MDDSTLQLTQIASIFGLAFFYFWPAMPAGLALGLHPLVVVATATASYMSGVLVVLVLGDRARVLLRRLRRQEPPAATADAVPPGRLRRVWERFGVAGLGLLAPMTIGSHTGALLGLALKARPRALLIWMTLGALGWSLALCLLALLGGTLLASAAH